MGINKKDGQPQYAPSHLGTKSVKYKRNKGEKFHDKSNGHPIVMQTKGE